MAERRKSTTTSNFGVGARESHDSRPFYERFRAPELSKDDHVPPPAAIAEPFVCGDARHMDAIADGSVALVVTSPPYFAGKQYEEELERDGVPSSYLEYLGMLTEVFAECARKLEPGGRMAVNVANLGRKPYRSLSADVIQILERDLGLLLRGELIWQKGEGATGSCAWGSFRSAANPVLRDITERVIVASKGRFDRARTPRQRAAEGLPHENTLLTEDFMSLTLDLWSMPTESARRVGHPAPFPVELPEQLVRLYTYKDDLVLDPFMGSGSTLIAAAGLGRRYAGYDLDPGYVEIARRRFAVETAGIEPPPATPSGGARPAAPPPDADGIGGVGGVDRAIGTGAAAGRIAELVLLEAGFVVTGRDQRIRRTGVVMPFVATAADGTTWMFDVAGANTTHRGGLLRMDTVWRTLGRASAVRGQRPGRDRRAAHRRPAPSPGRRRPRPARRRAGCLLRRDRDGQRHRSRPAGRLRRRRSGSRPTRILGRRRSGSGPTRVVGRLTAYVVGVRDEPQTAPTVPPELLGVWQRNWIEFADGTRDDTGLVIWLQLGSSMADIRIPADRPDLRHRGGLAECSPAELDALAASESSSGYTTCTAPATGDDGVRRATAEWFTRGHGVAFQPVSAFPEPGLLEWRGDPALMIERAPSGAYVEEWRQLPGTSDDQTHQRIAPDTEWYAAGDAAVLVRDRPVPIPRVARLPELIGEAGGDRAAVEALLDCEFSFARRRAGRWVIEASTLPWREGEVIDVGLR